MPQIRGDARVFKVAAAALAALPMVLGACASDDLEFEGIRLGMTTEQVRAGFLPGNWRASTDDRGTVLLDWTPASDPTRDTTHDVQSVRFEFHQGLLVVIRATLTTDHPQASDPSAFDDDLLRHVRAVGDQSVQVLWITRNCPIHRDEVEALIGAI